MKELKGNLVTLKSISTADAAFLQTLFEDETVKRFYVLEDKYLNNIPSFISYLLKVTTDGIGDSYIMYDMQGRKVGLITAEAVRQSGRIVFNMGYAVSSVFRNNGYASDAVSCMTNYLLTNFRVEYVSLDISAENAISQKVAQKCGFVKDYTTAYFDSNNPDMPMRFRWYKGLTSKRIEYFKIAFDAAQYREDWSTAVEYYEKALSEPYDEGTPYTNAQIYSNLGLSYSWLDQYQKAYDYFIKAQQLGLYNSVMEKEMRYLRKKLGISY